MLPILNVSIAATSAASASGKVASSATVPAGQPVSTAKVPDYSLQGFNQATESLRFNSPVPGPGGLKVVDTPSLRNNLDKQRDVDQLKLAESLAEDAMGRVGGTHASPAEQLLAQAEMAEASQIRRQVESRLPSQFSQDTGLGFGEGDILAGQIGETDRDEQYAFQLLQSPDEKDISVGATYEMAASQKFQLIEDEIMTA